MTVPVTREEDEWWAEWEKKQEEENRRSFWERQRELAIDSKKA